MKPQTIYHTGFVVSDIDRSIDFYTRVIGMTIERQPATTDLPWLAEVVGYEKVKIRMAYVGVGDGHSIELLEYQFPRSEARSDQFERNKPGSAHAAMVVDDVPTWRERLEAEGIHVFGPTYERDAEYPWARYAIYFQDPDGNWLEMISRHPRPEGSTEN
ncbi:MAG: VOC family protein [Dehalococcoidia bacterium]|jgi:lactoylglutathione lyase|nr:VOC family protein [Dehalococcoidia bacterium]